MTTRYRTDHDEAWRNELAEDMNFAVEKSAYNAEVDPAMNKLKLAVTVQKLCARLAEFEEIKEV